MANVVVTGGAGFIGSNLVDKLIAQKHKVSIIDNLSTGHKKNINPFASFINVDVRNFPEILKSINNIDYIFHLAALPRIQRSILNPIETSEVNVQGTLNILEAARLKKTKKVIFASSSSVYGNQSYFPLTEDMTPQPLSPYSLQKLIGEKYCQLYSKLYNLETVCLRFFSVYGPRQNEKELYATVIAKFQYLKKRNKPLLITGNGEQTRDFTHVDDIVEACISVLNPTTQANGEVYNVCSSKSYSVNNLAKMMGGNAIFLPHKEGEIQNMVGDYGLLNKKTGWKPNHYLEDYLKVIYK
ncbi:MAG: NAD-dependent epimerase/dehydratase family protein [Candidatus Roizmanbacteria bacterium]|nr:NAD-dependent epimerase/dehydratase family protein [Candidatus Roizmanbacteria bacterium]